MSVTVDLMVDSGVPDDPPVPNEDMMSSWCAAARQVLCEDARCALSYGKPVTLSVRVVTPDVSADFNLNYRQRNYPTNVLSFGSELPDFVLESLGEQPLGDLVICAEVIAREAAEQGKPLLHHWAHMLVHGFLHLNGLDHENDIEAQHMEELERQILATLDIADPYQEPTATSYQEQPRVEPQPMVSAG